MLQLCLLRHAKSDWGDPGRADHDRPLSERGLRDAPRMGQEMRRRGLVPDRVVCSTATRAKETLRLALQGMGADPATTFDRRVYEAGPGELGALIAELGQGAPRLLVVGHNPTMQMFALQVAADGDEALLSALSEKFPTAGLAVVEFDADRWDAIAEGRLSLFLGPRQLG